MIIVLYSEYGATANTANRHLLREVSPLQIVLLFCKSNRKCDFYISGYYTMEKLLTNYIGFAVYA